MDQIPQWIKDSWHKKPEVIENPIAVANQFWRDNPALELTWARVVPVLIMLVLAGFIGYGINEIIHQEQANKKVCEIMTEIVNDVGNVITYETCLKTEE